MTLQTSGTVSVNGLSMYYEIHGAGPPLILLHGAFGTIESCFEDLLPRLAETREVIAVELQAHGRTPDIDRRLTNEGLASDVKSLVDDLGLGPVDIVGYSLGGGVGVEMAIRYPDLVRRVVFFGGPSFDPDGLHAEMAETVSEEITADAVIDQLEGSVWHRAYLDVAPDPDGWRPMVERVNEFDRNFAGWPPDQLKSVTAPVLLVAGDADIVKPDHVVEMFKLFGGGQPGDLVPMPGAQLAILPGTNHIDVLDRVDWLHSMIIRFLDQSEPSPT